MPKPPKDRTTYPVLKPNDPAVQAQLRDMPQAARRSNTAAACAACKIRKTRCSGRQPCEKCKALNTPCVIDEKSDARRKGYHDRALGDLRNHKHILDGLLLILRTSSGVALWQVLHLVNCEAHPRVLACSILQALPAPPIDPGGELDTGRDVREGLKAIIDSLEDGDDELIENIDAMTMHKGNPSSSGRLSTSRIEHVVGQQSPSKQETQYRRMSINMDDNPRSTLSSSGIKDVHPGSSVVSDSPSSSFDASFERREFSAKSMPPVSDIDLTALLKTMEIATSNPHVEELASSVTRTDSRSSGQPIHPNLPDAAWPSTVVHHDPWTSTNRCAPYSPASAGYTIPAHTSTVQIHLALPLNNSEESRMAGAIGSYLDLARRMLSQGATTAQIFGPSRPNMDLLLRSRQADDDHSTCNFAAEICSSSALAHVQPSVQYAMAFMFTYLLRWMILTSKENFDKIPSMFKPTSAQRTIPHSTAIELCPIPQLRDLLCTGRGDSSLVLRYVSCSCVADGGNHMVDPVFEQISTAISDSSSGSRQIPRVFLTNDFCLHVMKAENWVISPELFMDYPEFRDIPTIVPGTVPQPLLHPGFVSPYG